jgi:hypothetical protein
MQKRERYSQVCFKESLIVGCWSLWNHKNKIIFEGQYINLNECFKSFLDSFEPVHAVFIKMKIM